MTFLKHFRRWHFDLALFVGLGIFSWAYWNSFPSPFLRITFHRDEHALFAGFSTDSKTVFIMKHGRRSPRFPLKPVLEHWDIASQTRHAVVPFQLPDSDRKLLEALPADQGGVYFAGQFRPETRSIHCQLLLNPTRILRLYDSKTGQCLTPNYQLLSAYALYVGNSDVNHPLALSGNFGLGKEELVDLTNGKLVHSFPKDINRRIGMATMSADQQLLMLPTILYSKTEKHTYKLDIYRTGNWELLQTLSPDIQGTIYIQQTNTDQLILADIVTRGIYWSTRFITYRFNKERKQFEPAAHSVLSQIDTSKGWFSIMDHLLVQHDVSRPTFLPQHLESIINRLLSKINRFLPVLPKQQNYKVFDLSTGQLLRQLSGLIEPDQPALRASPDGAILSCSRHLPHSGDMHELLLFHIPHYLWEPTLSWLQWLSWLVVIPWPFRYFLSTPSIPKCELNIPRS